jgi:hypothetical protein
MSASPKQMHFKKKISTFRQKKINIFDGEDDSRFKELAPRTPKVVKKEEASFTPKSTNDKEVLAWPPVQINPELVSTLKKQKDNLK